MTSKTCKSCQHWKQDREDLVGTYGRCSQLMRDPWIVVFGFGAAAVYRWDTRDIFGCILHTPLETEEEKSAT